MKIRALILRVALVGGVSLLAAPACLELVDDVGSNNTEECCPVSEHPSCSNFLVGGAKSLRSGGVCAGALSDNIPSGLQKKVDAKGCAYWELDESSPGTCGVAPNDSGSDADSAIASDSGTDADAHVETDAGSDADAEVDAGSDADVATETDAGDAGDGDAGEDAEAGL
ncbi:MAG TPA: hypothetical protein VM925_32710 [Labilithrix sp.]|nr:hypothetical protein [Labilithrix sp.]